MTERHRATAILPCRDMQASTDFYRRLGFEVVSDHGDYRILADGEGWHLHLNRTPGWPVRSEDNPVGLYLYVEDVDAVADRMRGLILNDDRPRAKPWGTYEFAVSDPAGTLVRIGRILT